MSIAEAIDKHRSAARSGSRAGDGNQFSDEIIWILGQRLQVVAGKNCRAGVIRRFGSNSDRAVLDGHLLRHQSNFQLKIQCLSSRPKRELERRRREIGRGSLRKIIAGSNTHERIRSIVTGYGRIRGSPVSRQHYFCTRNNRAGLVSDDAA